MKLYKWNIFHRKTVASLLMSALLLTQVASISNNNTASADTRNNNNFFADRTGVKHEINEPDITTDGMVTWDLIQFGEYYLKDTNEDDVVNQEDEKSPLIWRVLSVDKNGEDAFLISNQSVGEEVFDELASSDKHGTGIWGKCSLRSWLNNEFYNTAFDSNEQVAIQKSLVKNQKPSIYTDISDKSIEELTADDFVDINEENFDTYDNIYIPSIAELTKSSYGFSSSFEARETREFESNSGVLVWTRTPSDYRDFEPSPCCISLDGQLPQDGGPRVDWKLMVCPVLHLNLKKSDVWEYKGTLTRDGGSDVYSPTRKPIQTPQPNESATTDPSVLVAPIEIGDNQHGGAGGDIGDIEKIYPVNWGAEICEYKPCSISHEYDKDTGGCTDKFVIGIEKANYLEDNDTFEYDDFKLSFPSMNKFLTKDDFKKEMTNFSGKYNTLKKKMLKSSCGISKNEFTVIGYVEITYDKNGNIVDSSGRLSGNYELEGEYSKPFMLFEIPMYLSVVIGADFSLEADVLRWEGGKGWVLPNAEIELTPKLSPELGVGVKDVLSVGIAGEGKLETKLYFTGETGEWDSSAIIRASAKIHAKLCFLFDAEYTLGATSIPLWSTPAPSSTSKMKKAGKNKLLNSDDDSTWKIVTKKEAEDWNGQVKSTSGKYILQNKIMNASNPIVREIDGKKVMIFQEFGKNTGDDILNSSRLVYSVYENNEWSEPKAVLSDGVWTDGQEQLSQNTSDLSADLKVIGDKLVLVWQKLSDEIEMTDDISDILKTMGEKSEICYAEFDTNANHFTNIRRVTENTKADFVPHICEDGENLIVSYIRNSANDMTMQTGTNTIIQKTLKNGQFDEENSVVQTEKAIESYLVANSSKAYYVARNESNNAELLDNNGTVISGQNTETTTQNTDENLENGAVQSISALQQVDGKIEFIRNGILYSYNPETNATENYTAGDSLFCSNAVHVKENGKEAYVWSAYDESSKKGTIMASLKKDNTYTNPVVICENENDRYQVLSPTVNEDGQWEIVTNTQNAETEDNSLSYIIYKPLKKVTMNYAAINELDKDENGFTALTYTVQNSSELELDRFYIELTLEDGTVITKEIDKTIDPGVVRYSKEYIDLSEITRSQEAKIRAYAEGQDAAESAVYTSKIGVPDVEIDAYGVIDGDDVVVVTETKENVGKYASITLKITEDDRELNSNHDVVLDGGDSNKVIARIPMSKITYNENDAAYIKVTAEVSEGDLKQYNNEDYVVLYKEDISTDNKEVQQESDKKTETDTSATSTNNNSTGTESQKTTEQSKAVTSKIKNGDIKTIGGQKYRVISTAKKTVELKKGKKNAKIITIPDTVKISGKKYKVTGIAAKVCKGNKKLQKLTIGKNVKTIGKSAFQNCKKLKKIKIKTKKITSIGRKSFAGITKKSTVSVPVSKKKKYRNLLKKAGFKGKVKA